MDVDKKQQVAKKLIDVVTGYSADEACFLLVLALDAVVTSCTDNEQSYQRSMDMIIAYMTNAKKVGRVIKTETMQ